MISNEIFDLFYSNSLQLIHDTVVDTSVVFPHKMGHPYKRALRNLASEILKKIIQNDGKCSLILVDLMCFAEWCMDLSEQLSRHLQHRLKSYSV